jgi:pyroglutamyl-peptidase
MSQPTKKVLVTAFEPFGGSHVNPSEQAVQLLAGWQIPERRIPELEISVDLLPVAGGAAGLRLLERVRREAPDAVVCLGESATASGITLERVAVNLRDYRIADNSGQQVVDQPVVAGGPTAYLTTLPVREMATAITALGIPAELSLSAGTFLCNEVMYTVLHYAATEQPSLRAGFIHVPQLPEQAALGGRGRASMDRLTTARGIAAALTAVAAELRNGP